MVQRGSRGGATSSTSEGEELSWKEKRKVIADGARCEQVWSSETPESFDSVGSVGAHEGQGTSGVKARNVDFIL